MDVLTLAMLFVTLYGGSVEYAGFYVSLGLYFYRAIEGCKLCCTIESTENGRIRRLC